MGVSDMICTKCFTRFDACSECHDKEIAKRAAEIARLSEQIEQMRCCGNCKFEMNGCDKYACYGKDRDRRIWEIRA